MPSPSLRTSEAPAPLAVLKLVTLSSIATFAMLIVGCETSEDRQLADAQSCLDAARTSADADVCLDKVQGLESNSAYLIRCSANFVGQGLTGERLARAFQEIKDNPGAGQNPTTKMLAYMVFNNALTRHNVSTTIENCQRSGVSSMFRLATTVQLATTLASFAGGSPSDLDPSDPSFNPDKLKDVIDNLAGASTPEQQTEVGNIALTANQAYCAEGSSFKENDICKRLSSAISTGNGDAQAIGAALIAELSQTN